MCVDEYMSRWLTVSRRLVASSGMVGPKLIPRLQPLLKAAAAVSAAAAAPILSGVGATGTLPDVAVAAATSVRKSCSFTKAWTRDPASSSPAHGNGIDHFVQS